MAGGAQSYLHLLDDEVEIVPPGVGEQAGVEGESNDGHVRLGILECEELRLTVAQLDDAGDGDEDEGEHLGVGEIVLDLNTQRSNTSLLSPPASPWPPTSH